MIRVIIYLSAVLIGLAGCRRPHDESVCLPVNSGRFDATNAFEEVKALAAIVPRDAGSPGAKQAAEYILARLRSLEVEASLDEFDEDTPSGTILFRNVIGIFRAADKAEVGGKVPDEWIILGAHYDTKAFIGEQFQGANDSGSGAGVLLELARVMKHEPPRPQNLMFAFLDGEECRRHYTGNDGLHGSRHLAAKIAGEGMAGNVLAVIILDMVGDRDLNITVPRNCSAELTAALFRAAEAEGARDKFSLGAMTMTDDHEPFLQTGMPAIDIIDFEYGSARGRNDYWHTPEDSLDKIGIRSLGIVGRTTLRLLEDISRGSRQIR